MPQLRIALAQTNPTVGDFDGNADQVIDFARQAAERGADLVAFPEMVLPGYPVEDLALRRSFVAASMDAVERLAGRLAAEGMGGLAVAVGFLDTRGDARTRLGEPAGAPRNALGILHEGRVRMVSAKHHLPNYGVFDEHRYFVPGDTLPVVTVSGVDVAFAVCEDIWQEGGPVAAARDAGVGLLVVVNGSPYERDKDDARSALCQRRARETGAALAYVNMVGGQDELVFDGDSLVVDRHGEPVARAPQFTEHLLLSDLTLPDSRGRPDESEYTHEDSGLRVRTCVLPGQESAPGVALSAVPPAQLEELEVVYEALVTGTRDYVRKNGFPSVLLGLSGGIDSALAAAIATDAVGAQRVHGVLMPSRHSSDHSVGDAEELVKRQGIHARTIPVGPMVEAFERAVRPTGLAAENLQARVRGQLLMTISNGEGHLVLTTGNKSELATGYSTLYGDSAGGFAPLKDVWKTLVWDLARWRNTMAVRRGTTPPIPENSITKPPSAELAPGQLDSDSLPAYEILDALLDDYIETDLGRAELIEAGHDPELVDRVVRMVDRGEYKRRQYPPGPKISTRTFGRDRRLPITSRYHAGS